MVRIPNFLSAEDIEKVFSVQEAYRDAFTEPPPKKTSWVTTYLSTAAEEPAAPRGLFRATEPELFDKICALRLLVDPACSHPAELESLSVRCIELHKYAPGGGLGDTAHYDGGSVVTVDIMLEDSFEGGAFITPELGADGGDGVPTAHRFDLGDALVFPSLKRHLVGEVTGGCRKVMVLEFWTGVERNCDHRCTKREGPCNHVRQQWIHPPVNDYFD